MNKNMLIDIHLRLSMCARSKLTGKLYVADTNNSVIRILHLMGKNGGPTMTTLALKGVQPPVQAASGTPRRLRKRLSSDTQIIHIDPITAASGDLQLQISLPSGFHFTTVSTPLSSVLMCKSALFSSRICKVFQSAAVVGGFSGTVAA
jgi:hypothetical protein